jgi:hypothetical protein
MLFFCANTHLGLRFQIILKPGLSLIDVRNIHFLTNLSL